MAQEIERARVLLRALAADNAITPDLGTKVYQEWVATSSSGEVAFSRFLIERERLPAEQVQQTLRRLAVEGLPNPDVHTRERFEDLILCQLGVESGLISPKLVKTVRAVQEKKLKQGKLRRVRDLLPRAGFDPKTLVLLEQHMRERVLICPECLTRYPPAENVYDTAECPRCGAEVALQPFDLEASAELQRMPEHLRVILNESAERVYEPMSVEKREQPRRRQSSNKTPQVLLGVCLVTLVVLGGIVFTISRKHRPQVASQPKTGEGKTPPATPEPDADHPDPEDAAGLLEARLQGLIARERRLTEVGDYAGALSLWEEQPLPAGPEGSAVREEITLRVAKLKTLQAQADETRALLARLEADPADADAEAALARLGTPAETPPFDAVGEQLLRVRAAHRRALSEEGRRRHDGLELRAPAEGEGAAWSALAARVAKGGVELTVDLDGDRERVQVSELTPTGATLVVGGRTRSLRWQDSWPAALQILNRVARSTEGERLLVLRFALLARDAKEARTVAEQLGGGIDVRALLELAPLGAAPELSAHGLRLSYDFRGGHWPREFERSPDTTLALDERGAVLRGPSPEAHSPEFPLVGSTRVAFGCEVERPDDVELRGRMTLRGGERDVSYELRWSAAGWGLFYDDGRGLPKRLANGAQVSVAPKIELAVVPSGTRMEVVASLTGVEVYRRPIYAPYTGAVFSCASAGAEFRLERVWVVGELDPSWSTPLDQDFQQRVSLALSRATTSEPPTAGTTGWPTLSVEDPQGLAQLDADQAERLRQAKRSLREGDLRTADLQLAGLDAPAARFYKAYRACAAGDFAAAAKLLQRLLADDPGFVAARALLAYAFARAGRSDLATAEAAESIPQRMDLPWGHLADARARWQTLPLDQPLDPAGVLRTFEVPSALGAGDPLVSEETAVLRELLNVELALDQRVAEGAFTVCFASPTPLAEARDLAKFLESLEQAFEQTLSGDAARAQRVWLLHPDAALELLPAGVRSAYLPRFGALVFRGSPTTTPDVARAAADAYLARAVPLAPAWLRLGLRAELVLGAPGVGADAQDLVTRVRRERYTEERWRGLLEQPAWELEGDPNAEANAWALVRAATKLSELEVALGQDLERVRAGEASTPEVARLNFKSLAVQIPNNLSP